MQLGDPALFWASLLRLAEGGARKHPIVALQILQKGGFNSGSQIGPQAPLAPEEITKQESDRRAVGSMFK